jgi:DNA-binding response OmpR family regulator
MPGRSDAADGKGADGNSAGPGGATEGAEMRVLIAHSDTAERTALADTLSRGAGEPFEVIAIEDGRDALELLLGDRPPEAAFVDWDLPGIEGPEMCRLVRDFHPGQDTYLVVLASPEHEDTADAWRAGAAECISTPAADDVLRDCLSAAQRAARERQSGDEHRGRPTLEAVRTPETEDANTFFCDDDAAPRSAAAPDRSSLLQAVLVER